MTGTTITWVAIDDSKTCPICRDIDGYKWVFPISEGVPDQLVHPKYGVVWDKNIGSQAHGHQRYNCRCHIKPGIEVKEIHEKIQRLLTITENGSKFEPSTTGR